MKENKEEKVAKYLCSNCNGIVEGTPETCPHCGAYFGKSD
jgi:rubrerythrin